MKKSFLMMMKKVRMYFGKEVLLIHIFTIVLPKQTSKKKNNPLIDFVFLHIFLKNYGIFLFYSSVNSANPSQQTFSNTNNYHNFTKKIKKVSDEWKKTRNDKKEKHC